MGTGNSVGNSSIFPYFDYNVQRNVTTAVGQSAFLHCRVEQLGDKAVSQKQGCFVKILHFLGHNGTLVWGKHVFHKQFGIFVVCPYEFYGFPNETIQYASIVV